MRFFTKKFLYEGMIAVLLLLPMLYMLPQMAAAAGDQSNANVSFGTQQSTWGVTNPVSGATSFCALVKALLDVVMTFGESLAGVAVVVVGVQFVLARGNPQGLQKAKNNAYYVAIGMVLFFGAWMFATVLANIVTSLGGPSNAFC